MKLNFNAPLNSLSLGFVSFHILRQLWKLNIDVSIFPIANNCDVSSFSSAEPEFLKWIQDSVNSAHKEYSSDSPTLKIWHINSSWEQIGKNQYLYTFHECDQITDTERNILNQQKAVFTCSEYSKKVFEDGGVTVPVFYVPLGFDNLHFKKIDRQYYPEGVTNWILHGKAEKRKGTIKTIQTWLKKFGNDRNHALTLLITNPFFKDEDNKNLVNQICGGVKYFNVNPLPYLQTLGLVNDAYNSADIVLDLSGAESWSVPSSTLISMGKHGIIHENTGMLGWANDENSVLVKPSGKELVYDGIFFHQGQPYNQGSIFTYSESDLMLAFDKVLERKNKKKVNVAGLKLQNLQWSNSVEKILEVMK
jgi:hypothetical protein